MPLPIRRGTNISHWLSQSRQRGAERERFFGRDDVKRIADWGFDHIRLPIDEEQMWSESGAREPRAFELMHAAVDWCSAAGLKVIVDLHILRTHYFLPKEEPKLFTDPAEALRFANLWRQLSEQLSRYPVEMVAYELMNEAVATNPEDWNRVARAAFEAIRGLEPRRTIVLGSNRWNQAATFDQLWISDDREQILTFHFYNPMLVTHYRASWTDCGQYTGPIQYPGLQVTPDALEGLDPKVRQIVDRNNRPYDRPTMLRDMAKPLTARQRTGLPLYCGEFGAINLAPQDIRHRWYRDIISVFNEQGIAWANWDYKGGFGLVDREGRSTGIAEVMLEAQ
jgi:endoglucanase